MWYGLAVLVGAAAGTFLGLVIALYAENMVYRGLLADKEQALVEARRWKKKSEEMADRLAELAEEWGAGL